MIFDFVIIKEIRYVVAYPLEVNVPAMCFEKIVINKNAFHIIHFKLFLNVGSAIICSSRKREIALP